MTSENLRIDECMSPSPYCIEFDAPLTDAHQLMRAYQIRHLPVMKDGDLVGLVSVHDLHLMETLKDVRPEEVSVGEAVLDPPYAVQRGTNVRDVVVYMGARKYGSAVVLDGSKVVGVFTTVDAMRVLSNLL